MHDFLQTLSFSERSDRQVAALNVLAPVKEPLRSLLLSFNEPAAYRPSPRAQRPKSPARSSRKS